MTPVSISRRALVAGLVLSAPAVPAARGQALSGKLVLTGASTIAPLALEIAKAFESRHPGVRVDVQTGGVARRCRCPQRPRRYRDGVESPVRP